MTPALTELTDLGSEERDDLVLALLPPYRRTQLRHPVRCVDPVAGQLLFWVAAKRRFETSQQK